MPIGTRGGWYNYKLNPPTAICNGSCFREYMRVTNTHKWYLHKIVQTVLLSAPIMSL